MKKEKQEKYKSYNHNLKYKVENQDELEKSNKEEVLNKMNQNYNTKFNYNEETISHIDYILRKYNHKQKLVKEEIEYVLKYLHIYSTKRPFEFTSYLFEIAVFLVCILCNLTIYNIFTIFNNIIYNLINILLYIVIDTLIFYGARKIRKRIVQKKVTKLIAQLEQLLNPIEEVRKEAITEEKKEKNKEEVDTFIIYIGRLYNVIKNNGIDNFKEEIQSLHELANYYMDAKKDLNTTSEISVFYKCPDLWTRFNEIENKVNQKINCSKDIKVNEEYLSSLNMLNDIVVLKRRKEE